MKQQVASFVKGIPNSGHGRYVYAALSCGHSANAPLIPSRAECCKCGAALSSNQQMYFDKCACGAWMSTTIFSPDPWNDEHIAIRVGDSVDCDVCDGLAAQIETLRNMPDYSIHHARHNGRKGTAAGWKLYKLDHTSPSNFMLVGFAPDTPEVEALLRQKHFTTISPTEQA